MVESSSSNFLGNNWMDGPRVRQNSGRKSKQQVPFDHRNIGLRRVMTYLQNYHYILLLLSLLSFPKQLWSWMKFSIIPRNRFCSIIISRFRVGFRTCLPTLMGFCFFIICWFLLVPGRVPGLVSLLLWVSVSSSCAGFFWFRVGFRGLSPYSYGFLFHHHLLVPSGCG